MSLRILVCVKQVPDTTEVRIDPERGTLIRQGVESILNPLDAHAVEAAVALREQAGGTVTALTMGPPQAEEALRAALARGCDDAVLLTDRAFAGADTWATSLTLAAAVRALMPVDLIVCGKQAVDGDTAQVGPGLAAFLGWPQATYVRRIVPVADGAVGEGAIVVERMTDYGDEVLRVPMPAVLTVLKDLNVPRLPSLPDQMRARRAGIVRHGAEALDAGPDALGLKGSPTRVVRIATPPPRGACTMLRGEPDDVAAAVAAAPQVVRALGSREGGR